MIKLCLILLNCFNYFPYAQSMQNQPYQQQSRQTYAPYPDQHCRENTRKTAWIYQKMDEEMTSTFGVYKGDLQSSSDSGDSEYYEIVDCSVNNSRQTLDSFKNTDKGSARDNK